MRNPHFEDDLIVWRDEYSGRYQPPPNGYPQEFDLQWALCLRDEEYNRSAGASVDEQEIANRVYEWTGRQPDDKSGRELVNGTRPLDHPLDPKLILNKECIDIGCGLGRWTRVMQELGARSVLSVDMSESALAGVQRFNQNVLRADVAELPSQHPELVNRFDFANLWGVAMHTHDPLKTFLSASATVKPGGSLYLVVYAPEGMHNLAITNIRRRNFLQLTTIEERLAYVDRVFHRRWDAASPIKENLKNVARNMLGREKGSKLGVLDMLEPFYNWVIPFEVISGWKEKGLFASMCLLNEFQTPKCGYHVLLTKPH